MLAYIRRRRFASFIEIFWTNRIHFRRISDEVRAVIVQVFRKLVMNFFVGECIFGLLEICPVFKFFVVCILLIIRPFFRFFVDFGDVILPERPIRGVFGMLTFSKVNIIVIDSIPLLLCMLNMLDSRV